MKYINVDGLRPSVRKIGAAAALAAWLFSVPCGDAKTDNSHESYVKRIVNGNASFYGRGSRRDPKPRTLRKLDDRYGDAVWEWFCAMPDSSLYGKPVLVVNRNNGKAAVVAVADFGPDQRVHPDRKIDNSYYVAGELGYRRDGIAPAEIYVLQGRARLGRISSFSYDKASRTVKIVY